MRTITFSPARNDQLLDRAAQLNLDLLAERIGEPNRMMTLILKEESDELLGELLQALCEVIEGTWPRSKDTLGVC